MMNLLSTFSMFAQAGPAEPFRPAVPAGEGFWQPVGASNFAEELDWLYHLILWVTSLTVVGVVAVMALFVIKYRVKSRVDTGAAENQVDHNTPLEVTWSIIPLAFFIPIFVWGFKGFADMHTPPKDVLEIKATAQKWAWEFTYPNGGKDTFLHVPLGRDVRVLIESRDVLHSLSIPAFRVKQDAVPGRYTALWFRATKHGKYPIFCTEYCGTNHSEMLSEATVEDDAAFEKYLASTIERLPPDKNGEKIYTNKCATCHSLDGTPKVGPSWKGLFGSDRTFTDGSSTKVDENYIRQSIIEPQAKIVQGFAPSMPTFQGQLEDQDIDDVITYIKTLK
jgi:cytochrome c oxidase subunit 2